MDPTQDRHLHHSGRPGDNTSCEVTSCVLIVSVQRLLKLFLISQISRLVFLWERERKSDRTRECKTGRERERERKRGGKCVHLRESDGGLLISSALCFFAAAYHGVPSKTHMPGRNLFLKRGTQASTHMHTHSSQSTPPTPFMS